MADPIPPGQPSGWGGWIYLLYIAAVGWFGDWLRSRWQNRKPPPPKGRPHVRWDDDEETPRHHHRDSDEDEEG